MKKFIPYIAIGVFPLLASCSHVVEKTTETTDRTVTTVAHKVDPFATDTTTRTTQDSLQRPTSSAFNKDPQNSN